MSAEAFDRKVLNVEEDLKIFFTPHKGQKKVLYALLFKMLAFVFLQCGRKFGKTDLALYCVYWFAMVFDGSEVYYTAETQKHAGELVWANQRMQNFLKKVKRKKNESKEDFDERKKKAEGVFEKWVAKVNNSEMRITLTNGSFICVDGTDNFANADGLEPQFVVYDEFKHHDQRYNQAMEPNMDVYNGSILAIGTPPDNRTNYYCEVAADCRRREDAEFFKLPSYLNEIVYPGGEEGKKFQKVIKKYMDRGEWDILRREYYADIVEGGSKAIFPMFRQAKKDDKGNIIEYSEHVRPHEELLDNIKRYPKDWEFVAAMDPGTASCFAILFCCVHKKTKSVVLIDEIYEQEQINTSTRRIFPRVLEKMNAINPVHDDWTMVYDNAALWFYNEVVDGYDISMIPCTKDLKNKESKLGMIKDIMNAGLFFASDECPNMSDEISNYIKDKNGKIPKEDDHLIDALRYALNAIFYEFELPEDEEEVDPDDVTPYSIDRDMSNMHYHDEWDEINEEFYE